MRMLCMHAKPGRQHALVALLGWAFLQFASQQHAFVAKVFFNTEGRLERSSPEQGLTCLVPVYKGLSLVKPAAGGGLEPVLLGSVPEVPGAEGTDGFEVAWLGRAGSGPLLELQERMKSQGFWLLDLSSSEEAPDVTALNAKDGQWSQLRSRKGPSVIDDLAADDYAALLSTAAALSEWHRSVPFCAKCGGRTASFRNGLNRRCEVCHARFRPRLDPSVIVLVTHKQRCLLGRKAQWPEGRYSTLAGFVEFGETLEECVVREVQEESGVEVDPASIRFVASQPWLFPRSLMVGFLAEASDTTLNLDEDELEDVKWFDREAIREALAGTSPDGTAASLNVPSRASLANTLMRTWLSGE